MEQKNQPNQVKKNNNNLILGVGTALIACCICAAIIAIWPESKKIAETKPISSLTYSKIRLQQELLTGVQWDTWEKSIIGQHVQWQGYVDEVKDDITGTNYVWIDMDNPPDGIQDVYFEYPREKSLALSKGEKITFQGDYDGGITVIFFTVNLKDVEILQ